MFLVFAGRSVGNNEFNSVRKILTRKKHNEGELDVIEAPSFASSSLKLKREIGKENEDGHV